MSAPEKYGFYVNADEYYAPLDDYAVVNIDESIDNLGDFAQKYGVSYRMLKVYNPWLTNDKLRNSTKKVYEIRLPKKG